MWIDRLKNYHCNGCKWHFVNDEFNCCDRPIKNIRKTKPLKLICFKKEKGKWIIPGGK